MKSACGTLRILRQFKRFTPYSVRKTLAECLILSKLSYCNVVFGQMPLYLLNRLQRVQNTAAGYVLGRYAKLNDVLGLRWLPIKENIENSTSKLLHQALHNEKWPKYLPASIEEKKRKLRSNDLMKTKKGETNTFNEQVQICFNDLPRNIRTHNSPKKFTAEVKSYYVDKALTRALSK